MRKAAGAILIVLGIFAFRVGGMGAALGIEIVGLITPFVVLLLVGGGVCALVARHWSWAFASAVGIIAVESFIYALEVVQRPWAVVGQFAVSGLIVALAVLAVVLLRKAKTEFKS